MASVPQQLVNSEHVASERAAREIVAPFEPLPPLSIRGKEAIEKEALRANERYLLEFIERYAFCPFAKEGREMGQTDRHVHYAEALDPEPLYALMQTVTANRSQVVTQVIFPCVDPEPQAWIDYCFAITEQGHLRLGGPDVLACAPLHPRLPFHDGNPYALVPLFRRTPDPTIQWVRLDGLEALYEGRTGGKTFVDPAELDALLEGPAPRQPLYNRVTETNASMARRLSIPKVVALLDEIHLDARRRYERLLVEHLCDTEER